MQSQRTVRIVIVALTFLGTLSLVAAVLLAHWKADTGPAWGVVAGALGGITALLASTKAVPEGRASPEATRHAPAAPAVAPAVAPAPVDGHEPDPSSWDPGSPPPYLGAPMEGS